MQVTWNADDCTQYVGDIPGGRFQISYKNLKTQVFKTLSLSLCVCVSKGVSE